MINYGVTLVMTLLAVFAVSCATTFSAEPNNDASAIWKRYLSEFEQMALADLMDGMAAAEADSPEDATPQEKIAAARQGFEAFAAMVAPAISEVASESFSENGVRGVWFKPVGADSGKVLLYFHGGGYIVGSPATGAAIAGFLAKESGILCFSLDYPLAPESPFPAALDNAVAAYRTLLDKGFKPENIVLAGDSAGGGLALALLVDIRDKSLPMPAGAYLLSPWTDLTHSFASHETKRLADALITRDFLEQMASLYAGDQDRASPRVSPAFADLRGLPPLLVHVGSSEVLLDDSLTVVRNAAMADVPVELMVWPGYGHVFQMMHGKLEGGRRALLDGAGFLGNVMEKTLLRPQTGRNGWMR